MNKKNKIAWGCLRCFLIAFETQREILWKTWSCWPWGPWGPWLASQRNLRSIFIVSNLRHAVSHIAGKARDAGLVDAIWRLADHLECDIITLCFLFRKLFCQHRFVGTKASSLVDHSGHRLMSGQFVSCFASSCQFLRSRCTLAHLPGASRNSKWPSRSC